MRPKVAERERAIELRKRGLSYSEIQATVPISQASLSFWLRSIPLNEEARQRLIARTNFGRTLAGKSNHARWASKISRIRTVAATEAQRFLETGDVFWAIGTALYWAEGSKNKDWNRGERVTFTNTDPQMTLLIRGWLKRYCAVEEEDICYSIYIHPSGDLSAARHFWQNTLGIEDHRMKTYLKRHNPSPHRKNTGRTYHGTIRMRIRRSSDLNYRISGWIQSITDYCGVG